MKTEDKVLEIFKKIIEKNDLCIYLYSGQEDKYYFSKKDEEAYKELKVIPIEEFNHNFFELYNARKREVHLNMNKKINMEFLANLFKNNISMKEIKEIRMGYDRPYRSWNEMKQLFLYGSDIEEEFSIVVSNYSGKLSYYDFGEVFGKICSLKNNEKCILNFVENNLKWLKDSQLQEIEGFIDLTHDKSYMDKFKSILEKNDRVLNYSDSLFSDKENHFEYLNLNASALNKKIFA